MSKPHVFFAIPVFRRQMFDVQVHHMLVEEYEHLRQLGWRYTEEIRVGHNIMLQRNALAYTFLTKTACTHIVFIDDDVVAPRGLVQKLVEADVDVIGVAYRLKQEPEAYPYETKELSLEMVPRKNVAEISRIPGGFMCVSRAAMEKIWRQAPTFIDPWGSLLPAIFTDGVDPTDNRMRGEDYSFCRTWAGLGGKIHIMPNIHMAHVGSHAFAGNFWDFLRDRYGVVNMATGETIAGAQQLDLMHREGERQ